MSTMSSEDTERYNGYANRETWAFNLHWQNDQGFYNETLEQAGDYVQRKSIASHAAEEPSNYELGEMVVSFWRDHIADIESEGGILPAGLRMFRDEVGSWWRIDYREVGEAVRESLEVES